MNESRLIRVRDAQPEDHEAIRAVTLAAFAQYESVMGHWQMYRRHLIETLEQDTTATRIVGELNGAIVGSVLFHPYPAGEPQAEAAPPKVALLAVDPSARRQGVGRALLEECIRRARQSGAARLALYSEDLMVDAGRMYARRGFVRAPETDFSPAEGVLVKGYVLELAEERVEPQT